MALLSMSVGRHCSEKKKKRNKHFVASNLKLFYYNWEIMLLVLTLQILKDLKVFPF